MRAIWLFVGIVMSFYVVSCASCDTAAPRLRSAERKIIDSLYKERIDVLQVELDSICELSMKARVDYAVDSIMVLRIKERKERLGY